MVVVTTLVQRTNLACLSIEYPLHSLTSRTQTSYVVLVVEQILTWSNLETELAGILLHILDSLVLAYKLAELIVCLRICRLREVDGVLNNSYIILINHSLTGCYLENNVALSKLEVLNIVYSQIIDGVEVVLRLLVHGVAVLVHSRGEPLLSTRLTILLSDSLEIGTTLKSCVDAISSLLSCLYSSTTNLNLTILDRVRHLSLRDELNNVQSVIECSLEYSRSLTNSH